MKQIVKFAAFAALLFLFAPLGQAAVIRYTANLDGPSEDPPVASPGTGFVTVEYDSLAHTLSIESSWSGLVGTTTVAHIHCCTALPLTSTVGVAVTPGTLPSFPVGVTAGSYISPLLLLTFPGTFTTGFVNTFAGGDINNAEEALINGFNNHTAYFNIHSSAFTGGEIRGFLDIQAIPEPGSLALLCFGLISLGFAARRRT